LLNKNGFEIEDFGGSGSFCEKENINRHYIGSKNNNSGSLNFGTMRYRPHTVYFGLRKNKLYHPVKSVKATANFYFLSIKRFIRAKIK